MRSRMSRRRAAVVAFKAQLAAKRKADPPMKPRRAMKHSNPFSSSQLTGLAYKEMQKAQKVWAKKYARGRPPPTEEEVAAGRVRAAEMRAKFANK